MDDTGDVCWICLGGAPPMVRVCACRGHVHAACFAEMRRKVPSHRSGCPICGVGYDDRASRARWTFLPVLLLVTCVSSVLIVTVPNVLMCHAATVVCTAFHCSLTLLGAVVLGTYAYLWAVHRRLTRQSSSPSCCCRCDDVEAGGG
jgi:hypothetical protein